MTTAQPKRGQTPVRYEQRPRMDQAWFAQTDRLWSPLVQLREGETFGVSPMDKDRYVVVDEIVEGVVRLVGAPWPRLDRGGRLRFGKGRHHSRKSVSLEKLQEVVDAHRSRSGQLLRPIRIGDAFLVRGVSGDPSKWDAAIDVTDAARRAARAAFLSAVAPPTPERPVLDSRLLRTEQETEREEPVAPRPGSVANPAV